MRLYSMSLTPACEVYLGNMGEYRNSNLTYQEYDEASVLRGPKNVSIGADNSINLLGWYKDGTSRTFYLQDNQQLTTSQTSQNSIDNTYHANTYRREQ